MTSKPNIVTLIHFGTSIIKKRINNFIKETRTIHPNAYFIITFNRDVKDKVEALSCASYSCKENPGMVGITSLRVCLRNM